MVAAYQQHTRLTNPFVGLVFIKNHQSIVLLNKEEKQTLLCHSNTTAFQPR